MQIKILLVEDQKLMRIGIKSLFCDYPDLEIIGEAVNGKEAVEKARLIKPDIVPNKISIALPFIIFIQFQSYIMPHILKILQMIFLVYMLEFCLSL